MGNDQGKFQGVPTPAGIQSMDESLQKKFAKGIQFNSKSVSLVVQFHWLNTFWCEVVLNLTLILISK